MEWEVWAWSRPQVHHPHDSPHQCLPARAGGGPASHPQQSPDRRSFLLTQGHLPGNRMWELGQNKNQDFGLAQGDFRGLPGHAVPT